MKFTPKQIEAIVTVLQEVFGDKQSFTGKSLERAMKMPIDWSGQERSFIAQQTHDIIRWYRLLTELIGREPRSADDWWLIFGAKQIIDGKQLPNWKEFNRLNPEKILDKYHSVDDKPAISQSVPDWLYQLGQKELSEDWPTILEALNHSPKTVLRTNTLKTNPQSLSQELAKNGIRTQPIADSALLVTKRKNLFATDAFQKGWFEVQDFSSQQVAPFLRVEPGMRVIDACAGAGGKSLHLAAIMQNKGQLIALDTEDWKLDQLKQRAKRAGANNLETRPITSTKVIKRLKESADRVLLDVPCSGLGVLRRNPDTKWRLTPEYLRELRQLQQDILISHSRMVKKGGLMVYATCSILPSENEEQVAAFLEQNPGKFQLIEEKHISPLEEYDGFYMALLEKKK